MSSSVTAWAGPSVYVADNMDFGRIIPRKNKLRIVLDALGSSRPACVPAIDCNTSGGHPAALYFYGFGELNIRLNFPNDIKLYTDSGWQGALLRNLHMYSNLEAFIDGDKKKAFVGGELFTGTPAYGKQLTGTIKIEITTY